MSIFDFGGSDGARPTRDGGLRSMTVAPGIRRPGAIAARYGVVVGIPLSIALAILILGGRSPVDLQVAPRALPASDGVSFDPTLLALQLLVVVGLSRLVGTVLSVVGQPRVIGEMLAGFLLGPSVLGSAAPGLFAQLFPAASLGFINALASVGVLFFMLLVGLEFDLALLRRWRHTALLASHASIVFPFLLGVLLALGLVDRFAPPGIGFVSFALFMGAAISVTAFPVLARILQERGLTGTPLGTIAIACAAVDDATAWCILAVATVVARATSGGGLLVTLGGTAVYVTLMVTVGRALIARAVARVSAADRASDGLLTMVIILVMASAWLTDRLGIHGVFGAFLVGATLPRAPAVRQVITERIRDVTTALLLPLFFVSVGLHTSLQLLSGAALAGITLLILLAAVTGKLGGTAVAARVTGMDWRSSLALGVLMNTRGLMEMVFLTIGRDVGVLSPTLYTMLVLMALVTTALTSPLLTLVQGRAAASPQPPASEVGIGSLD